MINARQTDLGTGSSYNLQTFGEMVYIGKASNLQRRLLAYLGARSSNDYRYETVGSLTRLGRIERDHLTQYGWTHSEMPPWNNQDPRRQH